MSRNRGVVPLSIVVGASLLAPATAHASPLSAGGDGLRLTPDHGATAEARVASYAATHACPADHRAGARVFLYDDAGRAVGALSDSFVPTSAPPHGTLEITSLATALAGRPSGTYTILLGCFDAAYASLAVQDRVSVYVDVTAGAWRVVAQGVSSPGPSAAPAVSPSAPAPNRNAQQAPPTTGQGRVAPAAAGDGLFTLAVSAEPVVLSDDRPSGGVLVSTGALSQVTVTDERTADQPGWSVTGQLSDFTGGGNRIDGTALGWRPSIVEGSTGVVAGPTVEAGSPPGLTQGAVLATAASGGTGTTRLGAELTLHAPIDTPSGNYTATLTITALEAPL